MLDMTLRMSGAVLYFENYVVIETRS